jgi:hypothetical protein
MKLTQVEAARLMWAGTEMAIAMSRYDRLPDKSPQSEFKKRREAWKAAEQRFAELVAEYTDSEGL